MPFPAERWWRGGRRPDRLGWSVALGRAEGAAAREKQSEKLTAAWEGPKGGGAESGRTEEEVELRRR